MGSEYVDMESTWPAPARTLLLANRGRSRIIASWHNMKVAFISEYNSNNNNTNKIGISDKFTARY